MDEKSIVERLEKHCENTGTSYNTMARLIGVSASALSEYRNGKYKGDVPELEEKILKYLEQRTELIKRIDFCAETEAARKLFWTIDTVLENVAAALSNKMAESGKIGFVTGTPGVGKTWAINEYVRRNINRTIKITAAEKDSDRKIIEKIGLELKLDIHSKYLKEDIITKLKGRELVIIVDEGEYLRISSINILRNICDESGVGLILAGTRKLQKQIENVGYEYISSRTVVKVLLEEPKINDIEAVVGKYFDGDNYTEDELKRISRAVYDRTGGSIRKVSNLLPMAVKFSRIADDNGKIAGKVNVRVINAAADISVF